MKTVSMAVTLDASKDVYAPQRVDSSAGLVLIMTKCNAGTCEIVEGSAVRSTRLVRNLQNQPPAVAKAQGVIGYVRT